MTNFTFRLITLILSALLLSCSDSEEMVSIDPEALQSSILSVSDNNNDGNPSDMTVSFEAGSAASSVSEYRIFYVLEAQSGTVTTEAAQTLAQNRLTVVPGDASSLTVTLGEAQLDFNGQEFDINERYIIFILSVGTIDGNEVFVLSSGSSPIQIVNNMEVATLISNFQANDGLFVMSDGTIVASNFGTPNPNTGVGDGSRIFNVTPEGSVSERASGLVSPMGGALDSNGNFYFSNANTGSSGVVTRISPDGTVTAIGTIEGWPSGITVDENDNAYVANFLSPNIHIVSPDGNISVFASDPELFGCVGIDIDEDSNIITSNFFNGNILSVDTNGNVSLLTTITGIVPNFGIGYMTIFENEIYATGIGNHLIYRVTMNGNVSVFAGNGNNGSANGELDEASFSQPNGIAADDTRRILYISQFGQPGLRAIQF